MNELLDGIAIIYDYTPMLTETTTEALKTDLATLYRPFIMIAWAVWGIASWLWIRSRPTTAKKKLWHERIIILSGFAAVAVIGFTFEGGWHTALICGPMIGLAVHLYLRFICWCDSCGKFSIPQSILPSACHCQNCGHKLR